MTQGENAHPRLQKKTKQKGKFPIKDRKKEKEENSQSKIERKQKEKIPDQGSKENRRNMQKGLWTRQYLNNTKLSPSKQKN